MALDLNKTPQLKFSQDALREIYDELPDALIKANNNNILNYCLQDYKTGIKEGQSARVINNWINNDVVIIDDNDKGKVRRFNRIENIWLNMVIETRKFELPLPILTEARKYLFQSPVKNFSLLKFGVLETILHKPMVVLIFEDGYSKLLSVETYSKWLSKNIFSTHIHFRLSDFIAQEYPKNALDIDFNIVDAYEDLDKIKLLYFLRTGDYQYIKLHLSESDVRMIENSEMLSQNTELMKRVSDWDFKKADIVINDEAQTSIIL